MDSAVSGCEGSAVRGNSEAVAGGVDVEAEELGSEVRSQSRMICSFEPENARAPSRITATGVAHLV